MRKFFEVFGQTFGDNNYTPNWVQGTDYPKNNLYIVSSPVIWDIELSNNFR